MLQYRRPGAYTERVDAAAPTRLLLRSDLPAFIGIAEKGPLDLPVPVESFRQFQAFFGSFINAGFLAYCVRAFFENGGRRCWIVRVASRDFTDDRATGAWPAGALVKDMYGNAVWSINAFSEGSWGNHLNMALLEENLADTTVAVGDLKTTYAHVASTAGFSRASLVRISQEDSSGTLQTYYRVLSFVDEQQQRLYWVHPDAGAGLVYDAPLVNHDAQRPARITDITYRLDVYQRHELIALYAGLSLVPEHPGYGPARLPRLTAQEAERTTNEPGAAPRPVAVEELRQWFATAPQPLQFVSLARTPLTGGQDGLQSLSHHDFIGEDFSPLDSDQLRQRKNRGIATLNSVEEITLVAIPDIVIQPQPEPHYDPEPPPATNPCVPCPPPPEPTRGFDVPVAPGESPPVFSDEQVFQVQSALVAHCEYRGDRFALLDPPFNAANDAVQGLAAIRAWRKRFDSSYAALYFPWIKVLNPLEQGGVRAIPPCGHALGHYALADNQTGPHRAPANLALNWVQDLSLHATYGQQEELNPLAINVLRSEGPRGIRIMGARVLSSDPDWMYVNVRRLLIMIRRAANAISQWAVFEPNHGNTRNKLQVALSSYLFTLWSRGALTGANQEQAFYVKCDEANNPSAARASGKLLAEIGVAPSKPFEFVVVRIGIQENELIMSERNAAISEV